MARLGAVWAASTSVLALVVACGGSDESGLFAPSSGGANTDGSHGTGGGGTGSGGSGGALPGTGGDGQGGTMGGDGGHGPGGDDGGAGHGHGSGGDGQAGAGGAPEAGPPDVAATGGGAGMTVDAGGCATDHDCDGAYYCLKEGCPGGEVRGACQPRPASCGLEEAPVCGCDGITYFNRCLAARNGQGVAEASVCGTTARACSPGSDACAIRKNGFCAVMVDSLTMCPTDVNATVIGKCWVLPEGNCPEHHTHYNACDGHNSCVHTCDVAKFQRPFYRWLPCNQ